LFIQHKKQICCLPSNTTTASFPPQGREALRPASGTTESRKIPGAIHLTRTMPKRCQLAVLLVCFACSAVQACGYHDPAEIRVAALNWFYPNALLFSTVVDLAPGTGMVAERIFVMEGWY